MSLIVSGNQRMLAEAADVAPAVPRGRAGFYGNDLLDNLGRPSATAIMPQWQRAHVGDVAAPMATPNTSFLVADAAPDTRLVWA